MKISNSPESPVGANESSVTNEAGRPTHPNSEDETIHRLRRFNELTS
jgi:hypothetical protein